MIEEATGSNWKQCEGVCVCVQEKEKSGWRKPRLYVDIQLSSRFALTQKHEESYCTRAGDILLFRESTGSRSRMGMERETEVETTLNFQVRETDTKTKTAAGALM